MLAGMRESIFMDTGFFLALVNADDDMHASAVKLHAGLKKVVNRTRLVFTDYVFDEVMTGLKRSKVNPEEMEQCGDACCRRSPTPCIR
jgi:predicted nucleic acid-binding protein